jgi:hypothetical protein
LSHNHIVIDHTERTVIHKESGFDLLNPRVPKKPKTPAPKLKEIFAKVRHDRKALLTELKEKLPSRHHESVPVNQRGIVASVRLRLETLTAQENLKKLGEGLKEKFKDVFVPIPHIDSLPNDVYCRIKLKDASKTITTRS